MNVKKILAVINATYAVAKRKPEKKFFFRFFHSFLHSAVQIYEFHNYIHNFKLENVSKKLEENNKSALETAINIHLLW